MLPPEFRVSWPFDSGEEAKNIFSRWPHGFPIGTILAILICRSPRCFLLSYRSIGPSIQDKKQKTDFQRWLPRRQSWISDRNGYSFFFFFFLFFFYLQVTSMLPTKFQVGGSGEEAKNRFSRWPPRRPSWISDRNNFIYFLSTGHPDASTKFRVNWPFGSEEEAQNSVPRRPSWISNRNDFSYF